MTVEPSGVRSPAALLRPARYAAESDSWLPVGRRRTGTSGREKNRSPGGRGSQLSRRHRIAGVVSQFEGRSFGTDREDAFAAVCLFQLSDNAGVDGLRLRRNVPCDEFFALGENFTQRAGVRAGTGFFQRAPLHKADLHLGREISATNLTAKELYSARGIRLKSEV